MTLPNITLLLAAFATALMAGLFYAYSCSVNPGLARLADTEYLAAMQSINRAILNPAFLGVFMGALLLLPVSAYFQYTPVPSLRFWVLVAAAVVYAVGLFGVTMFGNVPLNNMLDSFAIEQASMADITAMRQAFKGPWNRLHAIRTVAVAVALILALAACIAREEKFNV